LRGARFPSPAPAPWTAAEPRGGREGPLEDSRQMRTRASPPEPLRYRSGDDDQGPCCCCQLVGKTLSMRAPRPHPGNFRVWLFSPAALLSPGCSRLPPPETRGSHCAGVRVQLESASSCEACSVAELLRARVSSEKVTSLCNSSTAERARRPVPSDPPGLLGFSVLLRTCAGSRIRLLTAKH
jgi:hypothetical protein